VFEIRLLEMMKAKNDKRKLVMPNCLVKHPSCERVDASAKKPQNDIVLFLSSVAKTMGAKSSSSSLLKLTWIYD